MNDITFLTMLLTVILFKYSNTYKHSLISTVHASTVKSALRATKLSFPTNPQSKSSNQIQDERALGQGLIEFINKSPEPFHCVNTVSEKLLTNGFTELSEDISWKGRGGVRAGGRYFFTRNKSSLVAFTVGKGFEVGGAFKVIGSHTDSPNLKIKPNSNRVSSGTVQLNVECYGGGIWSTWFDRELSLAGRVMVGDGDGHIAVRNLKISRPLLRIPSLCIHLRTPEERVNMAINKEEHLMPILCAEVKKVLSQSAPVTVEPSNENKDPWREAQSADLLHLLAEELQVDVDSVIDFELSLYDTQEACFSGRHEEYLAGSRIDNLASCFVSLSSFVDLTAESVDEEGLVLGDDVNMIALFDHEEVGSESQVGAGSTLMRDSISRVCTALAPAHSVGELREWDQDERVRMSMAKSFVISSDMAHAVHPNYASKHDKHHAPLMNGGVVIKSNSNQRYATNGMSGLIVRELARRAGVVVQEFAVRNDCPCGSTVGPIISANLGVRTADVGMPQLSMHSVREMMGVSDLFFAYQLFKTFFRSFTAVDASIKSAPTSATKENVSS